MNGKTVLIAGAGIGGPTLAYWLHAAGYEPTLVERAPQLRTGGYVIDFWGLGYDIAAHMGLEEAVNRTGYHVSDVRVVDDYGRRIAGFDAEVFTRLTKGRYVSLARSDLSRLIFDKVKDKIETLFDEEITAITQDSDSVRVELRRGGVRRFDLVVGADGLHSGTRDLVFGPERRFEIGLGYAVAAFEASGYRPRDEDIYLMYGQPGRMLGRFTLHDDRTLFLFIFATGGDPLPQDLAGHKAMLRRYYADGGWETRAILDALDETGEVYLDSVSQIRMPRWSQDRVALVGDAAFCVSLAAGQGSALAMTASYVLAGELGRCGGDHRSAFAAYESVLRKFIESKQRGARRFAAALAPKTGWGLEFRNLVMRSLAIPGVARYAVARDIMDKLTLPDYDWTKR